MIVNVDTPCLDDKHVFIPYGFGNIDVRLAIGEFLDRAGKQSDVEPKGLSVNRSPVHGLSSKTAAHGEGSSPLSHSLGELRVAIAYDDEEPPQVAAKQAGV